MKTPSLLAVLFLIACGFYSGHLWARVGVYLGVPFYPHPYYYPYLPYYRHHYFYPPTLVVPLPAPTYIQQPAAPIPYPVNYWYYCNNPKGYYPYIRLCLSTWQQVEPIPPVLH